MDALAKIAYKHLGQSPDITESDLCEIFESFPFTTNETFAWAAHYFFLEQIQDATSVVHKASIKPAAQKALLKIREHLAKEEADA